MENLKEIEARAYAGDANAQYHLAAMLDRSGDKAAANEWNEKAAAAGHPGAMYTLACAMLSVPTADMRVDEAVALPKRASDAGGAAAKRQLAVLTALGLGVKQDWAAAVALLTEAAEIGHPAAMRELAMLGECVSGKCGAGDDALLAAARKGEWVALCYALRRGLLPAAEASAAKARMQGVGFFAFDPQTDQAQKTAPVDLPGLAALSWPLSSSEAGREELLQTPGVYRVNGLLSRDECDYLICAAAPLLTPSLVVDPKMGKADHAQYRTSDGALFGLIDLDLVLIALYERLARAAGVAWANCELIGVLRYRPGQEYKPHHDYLPEDDNDYSEVKRSGQRARTLLVSLNDSYEGGATVFPRLDLEFRGGVGDALVFANTDGDEKPYPETLHAGAPVRSGEKWLLSLWCRSRRFWFWD